MDPLLGQQSIMYDSSGKIQDSSVFPSFIQVILNWFLLQTSLGLWAPNPGQILPCDGSSSSAQCCKWGANHGIPTGQGFLPRRCSSASHASDEESEAQTGEVIAESHIWGRSNAPLGQVRSLLRVRQFRRSKPWPSNAKSITTSGIWNALPLA